MHDKRRHTAAVGTKDDIHMLTLPEFEFFCPSHGRPPLSILAMACTDALNQCLPLDFPLPEMLNDMTFAFLALLVVGQRNVERSKGSRVLFGIDLFGRWRFASHTPAQIECKQGKQKQSIAMACWARTERDGERTRIAAHGMSALTFLSL